MKQKSKQASLKQLFDIGLLEYHIRVIPSEPIYSKIIELKQLYRKEIGWNIYANTAPHITLCNFMMDFKREKDLITLIKKYLTLKSTVLSLKGIGSFPSAKVLFVDIERNDILEKQKEQLKKMSESETGFSKNWFSISDHPHITIGKVTNDKLYHKAIDVFKEIEMDEELKVSEFVLMKRGYKERWQTSHLFALKH